MVRSFHHASYPAAELIERKRETLTVVLPAREVADTIGPICERVLSLGALVDQLLVVDAASADGSAELARAAGAEVRQEAELMPELGPVLGKGDALWRALTAVRGDLVIYVDSDSRDFSEHFVTGLLGPLVAEEGVELVKGVYRRPFGELPTGGGRVTELTARPLLATFYPPLAGFGQPLAGEVGARRALLERLPFATGYGVEIAMLIDAHALAGVDALAQVDLDVRRNFHQPLERLAPMAATIVRVVAERLRRERRLTAELPEPPVERPPFASLHAGAS
jgi:glucosyl-3-phosphoglycerate synthase